MFKEESKSSEIETPELASPTIPPSTIDSPSTPELCDVSSAPVISDTHPINPTPSVISPVPLPHMDTNSSVSVIDDDTELFTEEQEKLFSKHFEEGYDLYDPLFVTWLKIRHPYRCVSVTSDVFTATTGKCTKTISTVSSSITRSQTETDTLGEILVLPSASRTSKRRTNAETLNSKLLYDGFTG